MFKFITAIGFICCFSQLAWSQQWLSGQWTGRGRETSGSSWTMRLTVNKGRVKVKYPSLKCSGDWNLISYNRNRARFREQITVNRKVCEPTGNVFIRRLAGNRILFTYSYLGESKITARGTLRKTTR